MQLPRSHYRAVKHALTLAVLATLAGCSLPDTDATVTRDTAVYAAVNDARDTYLKYITDHSKAPRHGESSHTPGDITNEVVARSWSVMNRYLEYRKAGGVLPSSLPQLTG